MARIIYGGIATSIRGSVGGSTFQKNAFGFTIKNKPNMARFNTQFQRNRRIALNSVVKAWGSLSDAQRSGWASWAILRAFPSKHNPSAILSGYEYFVKFNLLHLQMFGSIMEQVTTGSITYYPSTPYVVWHDDSMFFNFNPMSPMDSVWFNLYMSAPVKNYRKFQLNTTRYIFSSHTGDYESDITSLYISRFGRTPSVGEWMNCHLTIGNDPQPYIFGPIDFTTQLVI